MWVVLFFLSSSIKNYLDIYNQSKFLKTTHQNTSEMHPKVGELGQGGGCIQPRCGSSSVGPGVVAGTPTPTATATPLAEDTKLKFCLATRAAVEGPTARLQSDFWKEVSMTRQRETKTAKLGVSWHLYSLLISIMQKFHLEFAVSWQKMQIFSVLVQGAEFAVKHSYSSCLCHFVVWPWENYLDLVSSSVKGG